MTGRVGQMQQAVVFFTTCGTRARAAASLRFVAEREAVLAQLGSDHIFQPLCLRHLQERVALAQRMLRALAQSATGGGRVECLRPGA